MKKQLMYLLLIGTTLFPQMIFAQESNSSDRAKDSSWGFKFGANRHWQTDGNFNSDSKIGFLGGMYFNKPLGRFMAISYEWQIMGMGYRLNETNVKDLEKIIVNRTYIQAIFNFHITPVKFIDISSGLYVGGAVSSSVDWHFTSMVEEWDKENNLSQLDAGAKFNISLQLNNRIGLGLEYYHGLIDTHIEPEFAFTNRAISLSAKYFME